MCAWEISHVLDMMSQMCLFHRKVIITTVFNRPKTMLKKLKLTTSNHFFFDVKHIEFY